MDMGSDVGTPLTGTQISIWPLPEKAKGHSPGTLYPPPEARSLQQGTLTIGTGSAKISFDDLYQQYYPRVLAYLRFRTGTLDVAEDLVSLVFERALTHLPIVSPIISEGTSPTYLWTHSSMETILASVQRRKSSSLERSASFYLLTSITCPNVNAR